MLARSGFGPLVENHEPGLDQCLPGPAPHPAPLDAAIQVHLHGAVCLCGGELPGVGVAVDEVRNNLCYKHFHNSDRENRLVLGN